jgi:hypothetical protein
MADLAPPCMSKTSSRPFSASASMLRASYFAPMISSMTFTPRSRHRLDLRQPEMAAAGHRGRDHFRIPTAGEHLADTF